MKRSILLILLLLSIFLLPAEDNIQTVNLNDSELFQCTNSNLSSTTISFNLDFYNKEMISIEGVNYTHLTYPDEGKTFEVGTPEVPKFTRYIAIPENGDLTLSFSIKSQRDIRETILFPRQSDEESEQRIIPSFEKKEELYAQSLKSSEDIVQIGTPAFIRNVRVVPITINAFQFNAVKQELTVYDKLDITVTSSGRFLANYKKSRFFEPMLESLLLNYDDTIARSGEYQTPSYLIIYPDTESEPFMQYMNDFIGWKHQKGFEVNAVSIAEIGSGIESIRNYIRDAYNSWENPPEFLCILGDAGGNFSVPTAYLDGGNYNGEGDYYYSLMDSDDMLADIIIGRISFNTLQEFLTIISKIFHYEKEPYMDSTEWYGNALLVGDPSDSGPSTISTNHFVKQEMENFNPEYNFTELYTGNYVQGIENALDSGAGYFHYRGFANMSGWNENNVYGLNNGFMLPFVTHITCVTGDFSGTNDCRSEAFLKYGSPSNPKGAIAAVGTATGNTHTCFNNLVSGAIFSSIFTDGIYQAGTALTNAKYALHRNYPTNPANHALQFSYWNNLMGDPAVELWTGVPQPLTAAYNETISLGTNFLEVLVSDEFGLPVENAWVTILMTNATGDDEFSSEFTDSAGMVYLELNGDTEGEASVTVTKHDFIPHLGSLNIGQQDLSCQLENYEIEDNTGNNDGEATAGETISLAPTVKNYGTSTANNVVAYFGCDNEYVAVSETLLSFGNIGGGSSSTSEDNVSIVLGSELADGEEIVLNMTISDEADNMWIERLVLIIKGNYLYSDSYVVNDENSQFDPGEEAEFYLNLQNLGSLNIGSVTATLTSNDELITVVDGAGTFGSISVGAEADNSADLFILQINSRILTGQSFSLNCALETDSGYMQSIPISISVGQVYITDPFGPDAFGYVCYDNSDINYMEAPTYQWLEIDPDFGGSGTELNLSDAGNTGASEVVDLPFDFFFYGEVYNSVTICTNGWIAPGVTENIEFMNWHIPGPMGPSPLIAPFWDDLIVQEGDISYYHNQSNGLFVIEWNEVSNESNLASETFQVILYDLNQHPTTNNNNKILFQYKEVANVDVGSYGGSYVSHGQYATVGIESHNSNYGLEYTYNNTYPVGAKPLENEMALLFTGLPLQIDEPYLYVSSVTISEDSSNNNQADNNDVIGLNVELGNVGNNSAINVSAVLDTESPYVNIINAATTYPDIAGGDSEESSSYYQISIAGNCPNGYTAELNLSIIADNHSWNQVVLLNVFAPELILEKFLVSGSPDLMLDPGETADVELYFRNEGGALVSGGIALTNISSGFVTQNSINSTLGNIAPGEVGIVSLNLTASSDAEIQHEVSFDWQVSDDNGFEQTGSDNFYLTQIPVDFEEDFDVLTAGWIFPEGVWGTHNGNFAGGISPELIFFAQGVSMGEYRAISPVINTLGSNEVNLNFHTMLQSSGSMDICVETTKDGIHWQETWYPEYIYLNGYQQITINSSDVGSETFQFAFSMKGESLSQEVWVVDNVTLTSELAVPHNTIYGNINLNGEYGDITNSLVTNGSVVGSVLENGNYYLSVPIGDHTVRSFLPGYIMQESTEITFDGVWQSQLFDFNLEQVTLDYSPEDLTASGGADYVQLNWLIPGATGGFEMPSGFSFATGSTSTNRELTGYNIYRDNVLIHTASDIAVSSYRDLGLAQNSYTYYLTAVYGEDESSASNEVVVDVQLPPPSSITATPTPNGEHIYINWTSPNSTMAVDNYRLYRNGVEIYTQANYSYLDVNVPEGVYTYAVAAMYGDEESPTIEVTIDHVDGENSIIPVITELSGNFPNPFNPSGAGRGPTTKISFSLKEAGLTEVQIYNVKGQKVRTLVKEELEAGFYNLEWNGEDSSGNQSGSGIYFYKMKSGDYQKTRKMMLLK